MCLGTFNEEVLGVLEILEVLGVHGVLGVNLKFNI